MVLAQGSTITPAVEVADQEIVDDTVTVDLVTSDGPGWIVIHADNDGDPGDVIGFSPVQSGDNSNVTVQITATMATEVLHAMLHVDAGVVGEYEFPGADVPAVVNGEVVNVMFDVTGGMQVTPVVTGTATAEPTVAATAAVTATATSAPTVAATTEVTATTGVTVTGTPGTLPVTGGGAIPWSLVVLALGGLILVGGMGLALARRS